MARKEGPEVTRRLLTLTNTFHNTTARVWSGPLSKSTERRVRRALCGMSDCTCGGALGERGSQLQPDGLRDAQVDYDQRPGLGSVALYLMDGTRITLTWVNRDTNRRGE